MNNWTTKDFFEHHLGSTIWPSDDSSQSPYDTFTCKKCGFTFKERMFGTFMIGEKMGNELAEDKMHNHLAMFHKDEVGVKR